MVFPKKVLLGSLLMIGASSAFADTAELSVIGSIVPAACVPTFAGGGEVDYGTILAASLDPDVVTTLERKNFSYSVLCDAPISIGTSWTDDRSGTASVTSSAAYGLGLQGTAPIGFYEVIHVAADATGDGAPVSLIFSNRGGAWAATDPRSSTWPSGNLIHSYAPTGTLVPGTYTEVSGTLQVIAHIAPTSTLDMSTAVTLDGLSTMTVRYL